MVSHGTILQVLLDAQREENGLVLAETDPAGVESLAVDGMGYNYASSREVCLPAMDINLVRARRDAGASLEESVLSRFATTYSSEDLALNAVRIHVAWKASFRPDEIEMPCDSPIAHSSGALWVCGRSRDGDAVLAFDTSLWEPWLFGSTNADCVQAHKAYVAHCLEVAGRVADAELGSGQFVVVVLMTDKNHHALLRPVVMKCVLAMLSMLRDQYPARLKTALVVGAPPLFLKTAWKIVRPCIDQDTLRRIQFIKNDDLEESLVSLVSHRAPRWLDRTTRTSETDKQDPLRHRIVLHKGDPDAVAAAVLATPR